MSERLASDVARCGPANLPVERRYARPLTSYTGRGGTIGCCASPPPPASTDIKEAGYANRRADRGACPIRGGRSIQQGDGAAQVDVGLLQSGLSFCNARQNQAYVCIAWSGLRFCNARQKRRAQPYRKSQISPSALRRVRRTRSFPCARRGKI